MSLFVEMEEKNLVIDFRKGFFCYNMLYRDETSNVTALTSSEYFLLRFVGGGLKRASLYENLAEKYDKFFILGTCDVIQVLRFYKDNFYRVFIYFTSRVYATQVFYYLFDSKLYLDIQMVDFFCREYQVGDNVHPLVRCDTGTGCVISAVRAFC